MTNATSKNLASGSTCPCGSGASLADCCMPRIRGTQPADTAESLLRARYTAFTLGEVDYIMSTHHSKTIHEVKREEIEDWSKHSEWLGLHVVQKEAGQATDDKGTVVFCARYTTNGKTEEHWEQSFFEKENGQWKFLDARGVRQGTYVREQPKIGRNEPCSCGSGKKSKKCCGQ